MLLIPLRLYPVPPVTISNDEFVDIEEPWPSTTPVTLLSSVAVAEPVLTFLPIGNSLFVLEPDPVIATLSFLGRDRSPLLDIAWQFKLPASIGVLKNVAVPDGTNFALRNLKHKSWYWLGVQIVPFCDLNKLPPRYCLDTITFSTSGRFVVLTVFWPIVATHISYLSDEGDKNTRAYSFLGSR